MREKSLECLCCPVCLESLTLKVEKQVGNEILSGELICNICYRRYEIKEGIPDLVVPKKLGKTDPYEETASSYDRNLLLLSLLLFTWMPLERRSWVGKLELRGGESVLEVATGTGANLPYIASKVSPTGKLVAMDLSFAMLKLAKKKALKEEIDAELHRANILYLPYKDKCFDAVLQAGGLNVFGDEKKTVDEIVRVAKPKAKIVMVNEGLAPGKENTWIGRRLLKNWDWNRHASEPPLSLLPHSTRQLKFQWILRGMFHMLEFRK